VVFGVLEEFLPVLGVLLSEVSSKRMVGFGLVDERDQSLDHLERRKRTSRDHRRSIFFHLEMKCPICEHWNRVVTKRFLVNNALIQKSIESHSTQSIKSKIPNGNLSTVRNIGKLRHHVER